MRRSVDATDGVLGEVWRSVDATDGVLGEVRRSVDATDGVLGEVRRSVDATEDENRNIWILQKIDPKGRQSYPIWTD